MLQFTDDGDPCKRLLCDECVVTHEHHQISGFFSMPLHPWGNKHESDKHYMISWMLFCRRRNIRLALGAEAAN